MAGNVAIEQLAVLDWVKGLAGVSEREFTLATVQGYMVRHAVRPESLQPYLFFSRGSYTRNLIFKNDIFECMAICWEIGQFSRVHNHRDQNCWMAAPIGRLKVQNFRVEERHSSGENCGTCKLEATDVYEMNAANPVHVNPLEPVHQVLNLPDYNQRAVSIHVYSKPFDVCEVYRKDEGTYADVPLHYTSEYGKLNPDEKLL